MTIAFFDNVCKKFAERLIFDGLSFELKRGGRYGLLGPNGAGKSTLIRLLAGHLRPDGGKVLVDGLEPWKRPAEVRAHIGLLPERAPMVGELSVADHLILAGKLKGLEPVESKQQQDQLISALSLSAFLNRPAAVLSQGQKRRAALAVALLGSPPLLILDEPTSGLDPEESFRLVSLLKQLPSDSTLLISSHILAEIYNLTDSVLVIAQGRLTSFGPWGEVASGREPTEDELRREYLSLAGVREGAA